MTRTGKKLVREQCYGPQDLRLGAFIHVYGRDFFIHDADDFTKHWYSVSGSVSTQMYLSPLGQTMRPANEEGTNVKSSMRLSCLLLIRLLVGRCFKVEMI